MQFLHSHAMFYYCLLISVMIVHFCAILGYIYYVYFSHLQPSAIFGQFGLVAILLCLCFRGVLVYLIYLG